MFKYSNMNRSNNKIDEKLAAPNTPLEDLLQEEEIIQEFTYQAHKFTKYFNKDKIKQLVDYIIKEPTEDDPVKAHKIPFVSSEILNSGERFICNYFCFNNEEIKDEIDEDEEDMKNNSVEIEDKKEEEKKEEVKKEEEKKEEVKPEEEIKKEEEKKE